MSIRNLLFAGSLLLGLHGLACASTTCQGGKEPFQVLVDIDTNDAVDTGNQSGALVGAAHFLTSTAGFVQANHTSSFVYGANCATVNITRISVDITGLGANPSTAYPRYYVDVGGLAEMRESNCYGRIGPGDRLELGGMIMALGKHDLPVTDGENDISALIAKSTKILDLDNGVDPDKRQNYLFYMTCHKVLGEK